MSKTSKSKKLDVLCIHCQSQLNSEYYCISCVRQYLESGFSQWDSYDRLILDSKFTKEGGFGTIYKATWIDGNIVGWDEHNQSFKRIGVMNVALKTLLKSRNPNENFFKEVCIF